MTGFFSKENFNDKLDGAFQLEASEKSYKKQRKMLKKIRKDHKHEVYQYVVNRLNSIEAYPHRSLYEFLAKYHINDALDLLIRKINHPAKCDEKTRAILAFDVCDLNQLQEWQKKIIWETMLSIFSAENESNDDRLYSGIVLLKMDFVEASVLLRQILNNIKDTDKIEYLVEPLDVYLRKS